MKQLEHFFAPPFTATGELAQSYASLKLENSSPLDGWMLGKLSVNQEYSAAGFSGDIPENTLGADLLARGYQAVTEASAVQWN